jgi:hypothetical protein
LIISVCLFDTEDPDERMPIARVRHGDQGHLVAWAHVRHEDLVVHTGHTVPYWVRVDCLARHIVDWIHDLIEAGELPPINTFEDVCELADTTQWTEALAYLDYISWEHVCWHVTVLLELACTTVGYA